MADSYAAVVPNALALRLFIAGIVLAALLFVASVLRPLSRWVTEVRMGWDDGLAFFAFVCSTIQTVLFSLLVFGGLGRPLDDVPSLNRQDISKLLFAFEILHIVSFNTAKLSALCSFWKLSSNHAIIRATRAAFTVVCTCTVALLLWECLFCRPLKRMWELGGLEQCGDRMPLYLAICAWSVCSDLLLLALPVTSLWDFKMDRTTKLRLSFLFTAGLSVTTISVVRLANVTTIEYHRSFSSHSVVATFLANFETQLLVTCISLPMVYTLYTKHMSERDTTRYTGDHPTRTLSSAFSRGRGPQNQKFNPLETTYPDPFELSQIHSIYSPKKHIRYNVSVDRGGTDHELRNKASVAGKSERDVEVSSGSETALVLDKSDGIVVQKKWSVSRT
ncbi:hypothetical protein F5Y15DRAFT_233564 [Xylariaceae sp. FL0016]|nr:hypothetical protein F5Y15DRAFT_233564 [Xylariaceae sp. FL0016]